MFVEVTGVLQNKQTDKIKAKKACIDHIPQVLFLFRAVALHTSVYVVMVEENSRHQCGPWRPFLDPLSGGLGHRPRVHSYLRLDASTFFSSSLWFMISDSGDMVGGRCMLGLLYLDILELRGKVIARVIVVPRLLP